MTGLTPDPSPSPDFTAVAATELAMPLAVFSRAQPVGVRRQIQLSPTLDAETRRDLVEGAGLATVRGLAATITTVERQWSLPDTVAPGLTLLICGLNPSPASADTGIGFARAGNRFWPAAVDAALVERDRDPDHALWNCGVGMTDLVKRTTRRADELQVAEYRQGLQRVERLIRRLQPRAVCFVGLAGWRIVHDRKATVGWQPEPLAGVPLYLMPSTSGLNASSQHKDFVQHFRALKHPPD